MKRKGLAYAGLFFSPLEKIIGFIKGAKKFSNRF
jgi:hypothetical protein